MKKILTLLLIVVSLQMFAQSYPITGITISLPANPDANTANWATGASMLTITAASRLVNGKMDSRLQESRLLVTIKKGGAKICGTYTGNTAPSANFNAVNKVWSGSNAVSLLGKDCILPPGDYELCVQFFGYSLAAASAPLSEEKCKTFSIKGNEQQIYQPPQIIKPANGTVFSEADTKKPINFLWTPVVPRPNEPITYRLKIWQLMQGQNAAQAMKVNQPLITKDVDNLTQAVISNLITGPCKPPYMCDFIWNVEAVSTERVQAGNPKSYGTSQPTTFSVISPCTPEYEMKFDGVSCGDDGKVHVTGHIVITPKPGVTITQITLTGLKETNSSGVNVSTNVTLPLNLTATGNNYSFSFIINDNLCNKNLYVGYTITSTCSTTGITSPTYCADFVAIPCCTCTFCDQYKDWGFSSENVTATTDVPNSINVSTTVNAPNISIKSFKAELISFVQNGKQEECFGCNKDGQTFGNFTGGTFGAWGNGFFPLAGTNTTHHTLTWFSATGATTNLSGSALNLSFTAPPLSALGCCDDEIQFCIRYSFTDKDCRTCSFVKCYTVTRKH